MRFFVLFAVALFGIADAASAQSTYVPITITESEYNKIVELLANKPNALAIVQAQEAAAVAAANAAAALSSALQQNMANTHASAAAAAAAQLAAQNLPSN